MKLSSKALELVDEMKNKPLITEDEQDKFFRGYGRRVNLKEIPMENGDIIDMEDRLKYELINGNMNSVECVIHEHKGHRVAEKVIRTGNAITVKEFEDRYGIKLNIKY